MTKVNKTGQRIGDWFLWIECEVAKTESYRKIPLVTIRKAISGGDVLSTVVATPSMVKELRNAADQIEQVMSGLNGDDVEAAE